MPEGLVAERHDIAMALLLCISDVHRWSGNAVCTPLLVVLHLSGDSIRTNEIQKLLQQKEGDGKYDDDDDYFSVDLDMCQVCRKVSNARRRLDKSINRVPEVDV